MSGKLIYPTPQITTGNWATVNDSVAQNKVGGIYPSYDSKNRPIWIKYVQFNPTAAAAMVAGAPVYYKDLTRTIVTNTVTEAASHVALSCRANQSLAGLLGNASATVGYFIFILVKGPFDAISVPAATVSGDLLIASNAAATVPTDNVFARVAAGTAPAISEWAGSGYCVSLGAVAAGIAPGYVRCDPS